MHADTAYSVYIQDPSQPGRSLLDALADAAHGAERGGAIFAFASARGVTALLDDPVIEPLTKTASFDLVVGSDAITDTRALSALSARLPDRPGLTARVLVHKLSALFHPKLSWFAHGNDLVLVVGSGNLTPGGLTSNFEAFSVAELHGDAATNAEANIHAWLERWDDFLFAPDSSEAQERAKKNSGAERSLKRPMKTEDEDTPPGKTTDDEVADTSDALVLEIPRNAPLRTQLDVGQEHFLNFFGGEEGKQKRILIQHVAADGTLDELEPPRALFRTKSRNYRFEALAGKGKAYPESGRPIGVFVRTAAGVFRYRLLWPGDVGHHEVDAFLTERAGPAAKNMRREPATVSDLRAIWPGAFFVPGK